MAKRKHFKRGAESPEPTPRAGRAMPENSAGTPPALPSERRVFFPGNIAPSRSFNFAPYYGLGIDEITGHCQRAIERLLQAGHREQTSVHTYCANGMVYFLPFCAEVSAGLRRALTPADINRELIERYIDHLARLTRSNGTEPLGYTLQKNIYTRTKSVLVALCEVAVLPHPSQLFPRNPYPGSNKRHQSAKALSARERRALVGALKRDLDALFEDRFPSPMPQALGVCLLAIALRTGCNTTPLLELGRDAVREHPLQPARKLLITVKRRGSNAEHLNALRAPMCVDTLSTVRTDVVAIVDKVLALTEPLVAQAAPEYRDRLWLYRSQGAHRGSIIALTTRTLGNAIRHFVTRHGLLADDGKPLLVQVSRLRQTFVDQLWRLSGGDPFAVARLAGHTVKVFNDHYAEVTPEMARNHRLLGEVWVDQLRGRAPTEHTPVARCRDPRNGHRAPQDGSACTAFMHCFRCRSFVVTGEEADLYRLYSFYWLLVKERNLIGARRWARFYGGIIRTIDEQIAPCFDAARVQAVRERARVDPHPFWRDRATLGALT